MNLLTVVDAEREADELRQDRRAPRPGLDHFIAARIARLLCLFQQIAVDETDLSKPNVPPDLLPNVSCGRATAANDELVGPTCPSSNACGLALGRLAPRASPDAGRRRCGPRRRRAGDPPGSSRHRGHAKDACPSTVCGRLYPDLDVLLIRRSKPHRSWPCTHRAPVLHLAGSQSLQDAHSRWSRPTSCT